MTMTTEDVLRAVSKTLFEQVLPELQPATWIASNVRACAMLLVYLEDRVAMERPMLLATNGLMRAFLGRAASRDSGDGLTQELRTVLSRFPETSAETGLDALRDENDAYKRALERVALAMAGTDDGLRGALRDCLAMLEAAEQPMTARANQHVPL